MGVLVAQAQSPGKPCDDGPVSAVEQLPCGIAIIGIEPIEERGGRVRDIQHGPNSKVPDPGSQSTPSAMG